MIHHIKRATRHLIFWSLISVAIGLTCLRLLLSGIEHYKADLATNISALVGTPVTIGHLRANMRGFTPQLMLKDIAIAAVASAGNENPAIQFNEIRLGINLLDLLVSRDALSSSRVTLVGAKLSIKRQQDGSIVIVGLKASDGQPQWLLQGGKYEVLQSEVSWQDETNHSRPLLFNGVDLAIRNEGERHWLNMVIKLPKRIGDTLRLSMDFEGNVFEPATIHGRVYIDGKAVNLPELAALSPAPVWDRINVNTGTGDVQIWADWQHSQFMAMDVAAQLHQTMFVRKDKQVFFVNELSTRLHGGLNQVANGPSHQWQLDVNEFSMETQADPKGAVKKWPVAELSVSVQGRDNNALPKIALFAQRLDLQEVSGLAQFFVPLSDGQASKLAQAQLKGLIEEFSLFADLDEKTITVNGKFAGLSVAPDAGLPGIDNLAGQIQGSEKAGVLRLATDDAQLIAPDFFREAFIIKKLKGAISWRQTDANWTVSSQALELNLQGLQSTNRLSLIFPKTNELPFLDLQSSFVSGDISQAKHYFPAKVMKPDDVIWYDQAFLGGRVTKGGLLYVGKLGVFPTKVEDGVFEVLLEVDQLNLAYLPDWPQITNLAGEVVILQNVMTCEIHQGQSNNLNITHATVINPALGTTKIITVKGDLEGEIVDVFSFLQQTPLASKVGFLVDAVVPQGKTKVALDLILPLAEEVKPKVYGVAKFNQASLNVTALDLGISKIDGELKFTENGVYSDAIQAEALGQPIKVNIDKADQQQTFVNITGNAEIYDLQQKFKMSGWELAKGAMAYQLKLGLPYPGSPSELIAQSDLDGIALDLPGFLAKTKDQKKPLSLTFGLSDQTLLPITVNYNDQLKAAVKLNLAQQRVHSGHILVGSGEVEQPSESGLTLELNQDTLNLQDWLGLATQQNNKSSGDGNDIRQIKIHSQHAQWKNTPLGAFDLSLKPEGGHWTGAINSAFATGTMHIPVAFKGDERIILDMTSLDFSALKQPDSKSGVVQSKAAEPELELAPASLPLLSITSNKTLWRSVDLGRLSLETERIPGGMGFKSLALTGTDLKIALSGGEWTSSPGVDLYALRQSGMTASGKRSKTHMEGRLELARVGELLKQVGITKDLSETSAIIDFKVNWDAAPYQFSLAEMKGRVDVDFQNGRILSIEPGFGRILGMLAMAQWIKRAQLDFSDIYQEGLTFNSIKGHFNLAGGIASTQDLVVDAVPAKIAINGDTDLVKQTVDHIVNVTPKSADAVPIAGTIMGKVAALVGRSLTGKDQEGFFFGSQYLVKGAWENAEIIPMHKNDGLLQKTWNGITNFPWLQQEEQ